MVRNPASKKQALMIRATRGRSRSTNHWKGGWMVRLGPKRLDLRWVVPGPMALFYEFFFGRVFFSRFLAI